MNTHPVRFPGQGRFGSGGPDFERADRQQRRPDGLIEVIDFVMGKQISDWAHVMQASLISRGCNLNRP